MALVKPLSPDANEEVAELAKFFNETLGFCPNSVLTMQIRPDIAKAFINLNMAVMANKGRVTSSLKRLIGYMASYTAGCQYCQAHTALAAERYGASDEQMNNIWEYKIHPAFNNAERAALDFAVAAAAIPNAVDEEISSKLHEFWDDGEIVEMMGVVALFGYLNRWNDSMATEMESGAVQTGEKYLKHKGWTVGKHM
ncbi:MAG: carboxymuconolactone decarboxylase family protein [Bacteroidota bacterium]